MGIPVYLQQFKAAGIYRVVFDKSTILNVDAEILRLVVGYSEVGPFNVPTYIKSVSEFKAIYGDISKKLEKRGIYFHRLALQALASGPILCLNLKKFDGETVDGATISTDFNPTFTPIDTVKLKVEDIYDTSRFWTLDAEKLNGLRAVDGTNMDQYINISMTDTKKNSVTYFIRKASGNKVNEFNISVSDWYSDGFEEMPEYLEPYTQNMISDFFAEIYVFKGKFKTQQVLASSTLKNFFNVDKDSEDNDILTLKPYVINAFGEVADTLDELYKEETSNAIGHYVGSLIPYFKDKKGVYQSLNILFNNDRDIHNCMMSFNLDKLEEEGTANIELSGKRFIKDDMPLAPTAVNAKGISLTEIFEGTKTTSLLGNLESTVVNDKIEFVSEAITNYVSFDSKKTKISGTLYVKDFQSPADGTSTIVLSQVLKDGEGGDQVTINCESQGEMYSILKKLGAAYISSADDNNSVYYNGKYYSAYLPGQGTYYDGEAFEYDEDNEEYSLVGPKYVINSIAKVESTDTPNVYTDDNGDMKVSLNELAVITKSNYNVEHSVYGSSVSFIKTSDNWQECPVDLWEDSKVSTKAGDREWIWISKDEASLTTIFQVGDCVLCGDGLADMDGDGIYGYLAGRDGNQDGIEDNDLDDKPNGFYDNIFVTNTGIITLDNGEEVNFVAFTGKPFVYSKDSKNYLVRIDAGLNQEIGYMIPQYLEGYVYKNDAPEGTGMRAKINWQNFILSTLTDYKGIRTALLNKAEIDYRYVVDTFESFPVSSLKNVLTLLCKEKQSAFAILNFPSVRTFVKCPYTSFTDRNGTFNVQYVVDGYNKKKGAAEKFSLPSEGDGASFGAFYTPLKFSDGYIDSIVPAAGLVSNLFMEKYLSRHPYYIIAGPNYGAINAAGLVGPDYKYSQEELFIIEPYGVNCMVYRPNFGTFINANQTAKQFPKSALSSVNVRELVIYIQDEIEKILQAYQWEFNNQTTRNAILDKVNYICSRVQANGGIQKYLNIMDESNNTPEIIDNEMAVISTHIEPGRGMGKMVQELTLYRTGQMSAAISE
jgi:hypothetical protein